MKTQDSIQSFAQLAESALDATSVQQVCESLREVCYAKQQHVSENWQDTELAKLWEHAAIRFDNLADWAADCKHPSFAIRR